MRNNYLYAIITSQHIAANHVRDSTGGLRKIFLHGQWRLKHHRTVHRLGTMRMEDDHGVPLAEQRHQGVQFGRPKVLSADIGGQFDTIGTQGVERIDGFAKRRVDIG